MMMMAIVNSLYGNISKDSKQKRNQTKKFSPCTSYCVLDCLLKASGAKSCAQLLYSHQREGASSRRPKCGTGSLFLWWESSLWRQSSCGGKGGTGSSSHCRQSWKTIIFVLFFLGRCAIFMNERVLVNYFNASYSLPCWFHGWRLKNAKHGV